MMPSVRLAAVTVAAAFLAACAPAPRRYVCEKATDAIKVDGRLDEADWGAAPWTDEFVDIQGGDKPKPRHRTRAKMLWDDKNLYVAARLEEPHVWGTLTRHDEIVFHDNDFEVFIDPDGDSREYYEVEINALGAVFDLFLVRTYIDGGPALHGWDLKGLQSAVHVDGTLNDASDVDAAWSVEFAMPWSALKEAAGTDAPPNVGDVWRMNFSRVEWRCFIEEGAYKKKPGAPEDNWVWSPQGVINMHVPEKWGHVTFVESK